MSHKTLIIDDSETDRSIMSIKVQKSFGHETLEASSGDEGLKIINDPTNAINLILLDQNMPGLSGLQTLEKIKKLSPNMAVIMVTGSDSTDLAIEAMRKGASDFITKPFQDERLFASIHNALKMSALRSEVKTLKTRQTFDSLIGHDKGLRECIEIGHKAAEYDIPLLITGETGTGKEVMARAIHGESKRANKPFVAVNCGAIPEQLVESTLFGHKKGAFTGAVSEAVGRFQEANGGTIFLDEIGDLPMDAQVKILRVLQQKIIRPVGGQKGIPIDVRIISATNKDLAQRVEQNLFREDLFFRLDVLAIEVPPLRKRQEDILELANYFIEAFSKTENMPPLSIDKDAQQLLINHWWPGNVREMENTISRAMVLAKGSSLSAACFDIASERRKEREQPPPPSYEYAAPETVTAPAVPAFDNINLTRPDGSIRPMEELEREIARRTLDRFAGNISKAARTLGISRSTYYRKLDK